MSAPGVCARTRARPRARGSSILEAVAALGTAALLLGGAASTGLNSSRALSEARSIARGLSLGRNVLDRALAAPCAPAGFAAAVCQEPFRCSVAAETLGMRAGAQGDVLVVRLRAEVAVLQEGGDERSIARLATIGTRPASCS
jgi:hypothetical protein